MMRGAARGWIRGLCFVAASLATSEIALAQEPGRHSRPRLTNLAGAREQPGLFTQRLLLPANFCSPVHSHDHDLHGLVLRGVLRIGLRDSTGTLRVREYPPGSFVPVPAGQLHVEGSSVDTEIHLSGIGPLRTRVVDSTTPPRCQPAGPASAAGREPGEPYGRPTVFARGRGEQRMMRGTRPLFIVADSATVGSRTLMAGYEDVPPGDSGRTHMHREADEIIFVHRGSLDIRLGDSVHRATAGATVFIPRRTWVGFRTVGRDTAGFLFTFNSPGFERCLRALSSRPGAAFVPPPRDALARISDECHFELKGP
jgi:quercetin dioxygenase-like cupin family protein